MVFGPTHTSLIPYVRIQLLLWQVVVKGYSLREWWSSTQVHHVLFRWDSYSTNSSLGLLPSCILYVNRLRFFVTFTTFVVHVSGTPSRYKLKSPCRSSDRFEFVSLFLLFRWLTPISSLIPSLGTEKRSKIFDGCNRTSEKEITVSVVVTNSGRVWWKTKRETEGEGKCYHGGVDVSYTRFWGSLKDFGSYYVLGYL